MLNYSALSYYYVIKLQLILIGQPVFTEKKKLLKEKRKLRVWKYKWLPWQAISVCKFVFFSSIARCMSQAFEKVNQSIDID